jgi:hypothetical protein
MELSKHSTLGLADSGHFEWYELRKVSLGRGSWILLTLIKDNSIPYNREDWILNVLKISFPPN